MQTTYLAKFVSKVYEELSKLNIKKTNSPFENLAKDLNRHFTQEAIRKASKHMRRCSTALATKAKSYNYTPSRMDNIKSILTKWQNQVPLRTQSNWNSQTMPVEMEDGIVILEHSLLISYNVEYTLTMWPSNPTPGIYPKKWKLMLRWKMVHNLSTVAKNRKQYKCPPTGEWIHCSAICNI